MHITLPLGHTFCTKQRGDLIYIVVGGADTLIAMVDEWARGLRVDRHATYMHACMHKSVPV